ncbi:hypothetical protein J0J24_24195, partial [Vibrio vulnificus]|nr:hypothetical protein [Vibrio vulnificus]
MSNCHPCLTFIADGSYIDASMALDTPQAVEKMRRIPYRSAIGSMYAMLCTRPDIALAVGLVSRYQS